MNHAHNEVMKLEIIFLGVDKGLTLIEFVSY